MGDAGCRSMSVPRAPMTPLWGASELLLSLVLQHGSAAVQRMWVSDVCMLSAT